MSAALRVTGSYLTISCGPAPIHAGQVADAAAILGILGEHALLELRIRHGVVRAREALPDEAREGRGADSPS